MDSSEKLYQIQYSYENDINMYTTVYSNCASVPVAAITYGTVCALLVIMTVGAFMIYRYEQINKNL